MKYTRRSLVKRAAKGSLAALAFKFGGATLLLTPEQAHAQSVPLQKLNEEQARRLGILAEGMVPGSLAVGVVHFVDHQLNEDPNEALLIAKYFGVELPYVNFYTKGIEVASSLSQQTFDKSIESLDADELDQLIGAMAPGGTIIDGYPIFLFYMCLRSDAVDVVYGTPQGFAKLNVPYMQHILPPEGWDA